MFQFPALASLRIIYLQYTGLPHSEINGLADICSSPLLIAACHVLHRLWEPRHPPYTLNHFSSYAFRYNVLLYYKTKVLYYYVHYYSTHSLVSLLFLCFSLLTSQYVNERFKTFLRWISWTLAIKNRLIYKLAVRYSSGFLWLFTESNRNSSPML